MQKMFFQKDYIKTKKSLKLILKKYGKLIYVKKNQY